MSIGPSASAPRPIASIPGRLGLFWRGITRRCPWCGDRKAYFIGWYKRQDMCRACGHAYRRGDVGFEWGVVTVNIIMTFAIILVAIAISVGLTAPDVPVMPITFTIAAFGVLGPLLLWPVSFTLWQAVDLTMRPPTAAELAGRTADHL